MSTFNLTPGINQLPRLALSARDGARAEIYQHGGHLTSWIPAGGEEQLFLSPRSFFDARHAIRGGAPVIFPQFGANGPLPRHGFARLAEWELLGVEEGLDTVTARFGLRDSPASRTIWPQPFTCELAFTLGGQSLEMALRVSNPGLQALTFSGALHTYLHVEEIETVSLEGLGGAAYLDTTGPLAEREQAEASLRFQGEVDRIYHQAPARLELRQPGRSLAIETQGFGQVVVWNPWAEKCAALEDMEPDGYRRMLCIEAAAAGEAVTVPAGGQWIGSQRLTSTP